MFEKLTKSVVFKQLYNFDGVMRQRSKIACAIGKMMNYNTIKYGYPSQSTVQICHSRWHESLQPLYARICIKLHNNTRLKHLIGTFTSLASVNHLIVFVIVPPVNLGRMDLFMSKIVDGLRKTVWVKHVCELVTKEEIDNNVMTTWSGYHSPMKD